MAEAYPGVMRGGTLTRVRTGNSNPNLWMMVYEWPVGSGEFIVWQFDDKKQIESAFGPNWMEEVSFTDRSMGWYNSNSVDILGSAAEVIGVQGGFRGLMREAMREAADAAGLGDPTLQGMIANNREWQRIAARATLGDWTEAQMMAELRQTSLWTQTLYPGIQSLYGRTTEPERLWAQYAANVEGALDTLGYGRDSDGSYRSTIGSMLTRGISDDLFVDMVPVFIRAEQSTQYRNALNQWTQAELGKNLDFATWFDVLAGEAGKDVMAVVEKAQLQYTSEVAGFDLQGNLISRIAAGSELSEAQALAAFNAAEQALLALGDEGLGRYGLTQEELISASTGISTPSGRSIEEVRLLAAKAATELGLADDVNTRLFVGFSEEGTPNRPGLRSLSPERA